MACLHFAEVLLIKRSAFNWLSVTELLLGDLMKPNKVLANEVFANSTVSEVTGGSVTLV